MNSERPRELARTALSVAPGNGDMEILKMLLSAGAWVNASCETNGNLTALQAATEGRNIEFVRLLLSRGTHVSVLGSDSIAHGGREQTYPRHDTPLSRRGKYQRTFLFAI